MRAARVPDPVERAFTQYERYIHQQAWRCARKLPPYTMYAHEDLVAEAYDQLWRCLTRFDPGRGWRFLTYYGVALGHRYGKLVIKEWAKGSGAPRASEKVMGRLEVPSEQEAWLAVREALRRTVAFPDRYRRLRRRRPVRT